MRGTFLAANLSSFLLLAGCSQSGAPAAATPPVVQAQLVRSAAVAEPQSIPSAGTLRAKETATISAQVPGQIRRVLVEAGDRVGAGQLLVVLEDAAIRSSLNQANAGAEAASRQQMAAQSDATLAAETLARYQTLKDENSVSAQEFDEVQKRSQAAQLQLESHQAQTQQAQAAVAGVRTQLGYTTLHAPFAALLRHAWPTRERWPRPECRCCKWIATGLCKWSQPWMSR